MKQETEISPELSRLSLPMNCRGMLQPLTAETHLLLTQDHFYVGTTFSKHLQDIYGQYFSRDMRGGGLEIL